MSKSLISDQFWVRMTEAQKIAAVYSGQTTLKQMSEGLLDGSEQLRHACREFLAETKSSFENLPVDPEQPTDPPVSSISAQKIARSRRLKNKTRSPKPTHTFRQRFGLPDGFVPRPQRYGRSVLLNLNVYRLPNGQEFIPSRPTGTLGRSRHLYALLTSEQYLQGRRGSVYVRTDGRIFDYSVDSAIPLGEIFDTGYTISDLERTGAYAPEMRRAKKNRTAKKRQPARVKRAAAAG